MIDENTDQAPRFFTSNDVALQLAIFDGNGFPVDLTNVAYLEADIFCSPTDPSPVAIATIPAASITPIVTSANWSAGIQANATISFGAAQIAALPFTSYMHSERFWLVIHGFVPASGGLSGQDNTYGAGWIWITQDGIKTFNLPLYPIPTIIPKGCTYTIPAGVTITMNVSPIVYGSLIIMPAVGQTPAGCLVINGVGDFSPADFNPLDFNT